LFYIKYAIINKHIVPQ